MIKFRIEQDEEENEIGTFFLTPVEFTFFMVVSLLMVSFVIYIFIIKLMG